MMLDFYFNKYKNIMRHLLIKKLSETVYIHKVHNYIALFILEEAKLQTFSKYKTALSNYFNCK